MAKIIRIDKYTDKNKTLTSPKKANYRYISIFNKVGGIDHIIEYSENGFDDVEGDNPSRVYLEGDKVPELIDEKPDI